jgi:hypothetical protein
LQPPVSVTIEQNSVKKRKKSDNYQMFMYRSDFNYLHPSSS